MPDTPEQVLEQAHQIAEQFRELLRDADVLPVLKLRYIPLFGGSFVEARYFDPERTDHMLTRLDLPPSESGAGHDRPEGRLISACLAAGVEGVNRPRHPRISLHADRARRRQDGGRVVESANPERAQNDPA
jgi:hypothetical protein